MNYKTINGNKYISDECVVCEMDGGRERLAVDCGGDPEKCPYMEALEDNETQK